MTCQCETCKRIGEYRKNLDSVPEENKEYFRGVLDYILELELDRDWLKSLVDGSNDEADRIIKKIREKKVGIINTTTSNI
jgi:hypothetical protein